MNLLLLGLNHKVAPVQVRERLAVPAGRLAETLHAFHAVPGVEEVAILSTCNRLEIYAVASIHIIKAVPQETGAPSL